jgi:hypothetical protein
MAEKFVRVGRIKDELTFPPSSHDQREHGELIRFHCGDEQTALERIAERGKWKVLMEEAKQRGRDKRGA